MAEVDFQSVRYSQQKLDEYFLPNEKGEQKRLIVVERNGRRFLEIKAAHELSLWDIVCAFFGWGPLAFKNVAQFCADHCLWHKDLQEKVVNYNESRFFRIKKINEVALRALDEEAGVVTTTPFIRACQRGDLDFIRMLMREDTAVNFQILNQKDNFNCTPLLAAASKARSIIVHYLALTIQNKFSPEEQEAVLTAQDKKGKTAFMCAIKRGGLGYSDTVLKLLIKKNMINLHDEDKKTALLYACEENGCQSSLLKKLLEEGADSSARDSFGFNALVYACRRIDGYGQQNSVDAFISLLLEAIRKLPKDQQLWSISPLIAQNQSGSTELIRACKENNLVQVKAILRVIKEFGTKEDVNHQDHEGHSTLMIAVNNGNAAIARELVLAGANQDVEMPEGLTLTASALTSESKEIREFFEEELLSQSI